LRSGEQGCPYFKACLDRNIARPSLVVFPPLNIDGGHAVNFSSAVISCLRNYANFSGRATRSEFWWWVLAYLLLMVPLSIADEVLNPGTQLGKMSCVVAIVTLALWLPNLAVTVRRLHDIDRSGWWILLGSTGIGLPVLIYWYCCSGTEGVNRFGDRQIATGKIRGEVAGVTAATQPA
jgi:uncharacterized membrane protein YhaH (DUF805 family)